MYQSKYTTLNIKEYVHLGRHDMLIGSSSQVDVIINELVPVCSKDELLKRLSNYLLGYKIGAVEMLLLQEGISVTYNPETCKLLWSDEDKEKVLPTDDVFKNMEQNAEKQVALLLSTKC